MHEAVNCFLRIVNVYGISGIKVVVLLSAWLWFVVNNDI